MRTKKPELNLYLLTQDEQNGYDTFDACVVAAETDKEAVKIHPGATYQWGECFGVWATSPDNVECQFLGKAAPEIEKGVILASFNAG